MKNAMPIYVSLVFLALGVAVGAEYADLEEGLVGHWKFDEGEGTTAADSSGSNNHGTLNGDPDWARGKMGRALQFDGVDDYVSVQQIVDYDFTLAAWIKTGVPGLEGNHAYEGSALLWSDVGGEADDFVMAVLGTKLSFFCGNPGTSLNSEAPVVTGDWVHVAAIRNAQQRTISIYINGTLQKSLDHGNSGPLDANPIIAIGGNVLDSRYYTGIIDEVRVYSRALSEEEVMSLVANDACRASLAVIPWDDPTFVRLALPWNGWRYALELSDTTHGDLVWRRENPTVVPVGPQGGLGWSWEMKRPAKIMRVAIESRTPLFGELNVLVNPITHEEGGEYLVISNVNDAWAIGAGFRPLGSRAFMPDDKEKPHKGDHATWMVKPSGRTEPGKPSPICEVEFQDRGYGVWHLEPVESGYVALGDYVINDFYGSPPPEGSLYRPVAVRSDLVQWVGAGNETFTMYHTPGVNEKMYTPQRPSEDPNPQDGKLFNPGRIYCESCADQHRYMLRLPLPQSVRPRRTAGELITFGPLSQPNDVSTIYTSHTATVPYTEVKDPRSEHPPEWQRMMSPFYTLEREEAFQLMQTAQNEGTFQYTDTQGTSTAVAQSYWESSAFTVDLNVGIQVKAVDISGGISVTKEMGWETSQAFSSMREKSVSYTATVRSGEFAGLWFRCYRLIQRDALGEAVNANPQWMVDPNSGVFTYYPPR